MSETMKSTIVRLVVPFIVLTAIVGVATGIWVNSIIQDAGQLVSATTPITVMFSVIGVVGSLLLLKLSPSLMQAQMKQVDEQIQKLLDFDFTPLEDFEASDDSLAGKIAQSCESIRDTLFQAKDGAESLKTAVSNMQDTVGRSHSQFEQQSHATDDLYGAATEVADKIKEMAEQSLIALDTVKNAGTETEQGRSIMQATRDSIMVLAKSVESSVDVISRLEQVSEGVGSILEVIRGIADQTNLLALNAAIEAARAGDQGRGFAVVADEVRTLAQRTQEATQEIQDMMEQLRTGAKDASSVMQTGQQQAQHTIEKMAEAEEALSKISDSVSSVSEINEHISTTSQNQLDIAHRIDSNLEIIQKTTNESREGYEETMATSEILSTHSNNIDNLLQKFTLH